MPKNDKLSFLEQLSGAISGQTLTGGARALGEGIGYGFAGGDVGDIPQVMREALDEYNQRAANQSKGEQDALAVASGLAAMSNPYSAIGHGIDFAAAVPEMLQYKLSDAEPPLGMIAETGLKRRLQKGGAQADYAMKNQLERAQQNLKNRNLLKYEPEGFFQLQSKGAKWGPGEGKFQAVDNFETSAYDLSRKPEHPSLVGMGLSGDDKIISGAPHDLGVHFLSTHGLAPEYRGKGYGKQIYQNMADVYGGGISHSGSTTDDARAVYKSLGAIDTGIPSGAVTDKISTTRQALPSTAMKSDPEALSAFERRVKEYANKKMKPSTLDDLLKEVDDYDAQSIYEVMVGDAQANRPVSATNLAEMVWGVTGDKRSWRDMPLELDLEGEIWVRSPNDRTYRKRKP